MVSGIMAGVPLDCRSGDHAEGVLVYSAVSEFASTALEPQEGKYNLD
jgi:hypothetical protein